MSGLILPSSFKKTPPPPMKGGEAFGGWAGVDPNFFKMPGGAVLQMDLSRLTLADFRAMRDHYQINSSLTLLSFMIHQAEWRITCDNKTIANELDDMIRPVWSRLIRSISQAYWAGYAPTIIEWENDLQGKRVVPAKFKDLVPESASPHWKKVEGWAPPGNTPPQVNVFDGIKRHGISYEVPVLNSLWYPILMENGDYYGRKLLRTAFPSWFFSMMIHLFANRYFERFGEPVPIGRADYETTVKLDGVDVDGRTAMETILSQIRNRAVVVLPSDRIPNSDGTKDNYAFDVEYLESQMRGADFEHYMDRLDEEMSLSLFTPVLMLRTADVGSYNLGVGHMDMYMHMLNAVLADLADYLNPYLINRAKDFNWGPNAPRARIEFQTMGGQDTETVRALLLAMVAKGAVKPSIEELGQAVGMTLTEVKQATTPDPADGEADPNAQPDAAAAMPVADKVKARIMSQVAPAYTSGRYGRGLAVKAGYRRAFVEALASSGCSQDAAEASADRFYGRVNNWLENVIDLGRKGFADQDAFESGLKKVLDVELESIATN